jgi:hypothetical protein
MLYLVEMKRSNCAYWWYSYRTEFHKTQLRDEINKVFRYLYSVTIYMMTGIIISDWISNVCVCSVFTVGPMGKAPSAIKTNIKAASQIHPYGRWISGLSMKYDG